MTKIDYNQKLTELGFKLTTTFVPYSQSRNYKKDARIDEKSLHWKVTLWYKDQRILTTDYTAGIGHCPGYKNYNPRTHGCKFSVDHARCLEHEVEKGLPFVGSLTTRSKTIEPELASVIYSLMIDYSVLDCPTYEEFADSFGYSRDSISGRDIYHEALTIALQLRSVPHDVLEEVSLILQDY